MSRESEELRKTSSRTRGPGLCWTTSVGVRARGVIDTAQMMKQQKTSLFILSSWGLQANHENTDQSSFLEPSKCPKKTRLREDNQDSALSCSSSQSFPT